VYEITDVGLSYVGTHCTKLETLNIDRYAKATGRNLTNVGIDYIARGCKHLKVLAVRNCNGITDEGIQSIAEHCHSMSILKVGGCTGITGAQCIYTAFTGSFVGRNMVTCDSIHICHILVYNRQTFEVVQQFEEVGT
jgi:F-box/leucine-rich repeat protein 7